MELKIRQINVFFFISAIHKLLNINFLKQNMSIALFFFRNKGFFVNLGGKNNA